MLDFQICSNKVLQFLSQDSEGAEAASLFNSFFMYVHVSLMEVSLLTIFIGLSHQLRNPDTGLKLGLTKGVFVWLMITSMTSDNTTEQY